MFLLIFSFYRKIGLYVKNKETMHTNNLNMTHNTIIIRLVTL